MASSVSEKGPGYEHPGAEVWRFSMATPARREQVVGHIKEAKAAGYKTVVVVSAMGRSGEPYATDTLLGLVDHGKGMDPRDLDLLMSCGEIISASVLVSELIKAGQAAAVLTGGQAGILTDDAHGTARIIEVKPDRVLQCLSRSYSRCGRFSGKNPRW